MYGRKVWHSNDEYRAFIWQCNRKFKNANKCKTPHIKEEVIQNAFINAYNQIAVNKKKVIEGCNLMIASILDLSELNIQSEEQTDVVSILVDRANKMISENSSRSISQEEYLAKYEQLMSKYEVENKKLKELNEKKQRKLN